MSYGYSSYSDSGRSRGYYGGGSRGSRGGSYSSYRSTNTVSLPPDRALKEGLRSTPIRTLAKPAAAVASGGKAIKPENVKYIGSYNWVDESESTIIVPGSPREWRDRAFPYRVPFDTGVRYVDQNGYRMGSAASCLLPLFRAVDVVSEENADTNLDWSAVDFVTDRNGLRKLMRWLTYAGGDFAEPLKEFRIDLQLGGKKTVLMHRWEKRTRENAEPPRSGCGVNFERESTTPAKGCERGTGHHRIVQYDFGGLKMVVRFEVDACIPQPAATASKSPSARTPQSNLARKTNTSTDIDSLTDVLSGLNVSSHASTSSDDITIIRAGTQVPQSSIVELTTRSVKYVDEFDWQEQYPQLLLSYTPHLFLAVHERGNFQQMKKHELGTTELQHVENSTRIQGSFRKLVEALKAIQALVKEHGQRGRLSLVCQDGELKVYERTSEQGCLLPSQLERFGV